MKEPGIFRNAMFGGFHKNDVLHYFETLQTSHTEEMLRLQEELTDLQQENQTLKAKAQQTDEEHSKLEMLGNALTQAQARNETLCAQIDTLTQDRAACLEKLSTLKDAYTNLQSDLSAALEQAQQQAEVQARQQQQRQSEEANEHRNRCDQLMRGLVRCENENAELRRRLEELQSQLAAQFRQTEASDAIRAQAAQLQAEKNALAERVQALSGICEALGSAAERL